MPSGATYEKRRWAISGRLDSRRPRGRRSRIPGAGSSRLEVLASLPESQSTLEQAFEIRLGLRPVLTQLGEAPQALKPVPKLKAKHAALLSGMRKVRVGGVEQ